MALLRFKDHCDYAFLDWMDSFPNSGHPLDEERFYCFAKSVAIYRNKKWLSYEHFEKSILSHSTYFEPDKIEKYWHRLRDFIAFHRVGPIPSVIVTNDDRYGKFQVGVIENQIYEVPISEKEYMAGGVSKAVAKQRRN